jgi:regulator of sigma E protease
VDIGLMDGCLGWLVNGGLIDGVGLLAATSETPGLATRVFWQLVAWLGVGLGLTFVIFVHELGHFLVAKACGVKCEKFYVGFDFFEFKIPFTNLKLPRSLIKFQWGETEYGLGSLPLGGYVKMLGQDDDPRNADKEADRIRHGEHSEAVVSDPAHHAAVPAKTDHGDTILIDPRSYPAKPVPVRMAIISAGVIMNVIFAVILAAIAYRMGVDEMPAIVGGTTPGGAAWLEGIEPGSKVIQIGRSGSPHEFLRWGDIRTTAVLNNGRDVPLLVRRPDGQEAWYDVRPIKILGSKQPLVGIAMPHSRQLEIHSEQYAHLNPTASPPLKDFDRVIEAAGQDVASGAELTAILAQQPVGPMQIKIERQERDKRGKAVEHPAHAPEVIEVTLAPRPMREVGLTVKIGPVVALRKDSPAMEAGLRIGDVIVEVNGEPVGDPLSLSQRLTPTSGSLDPIALTIERKDAKGQLVRRTISVVPELPLQSPTQSVSQLVAIEPIGVACEITSEVAQVESESPAATAGLAAGDVLTGVEFVFDSREQGKELSMAAHINLAEPLDLRPGKQTWAQALYGIQMLLPDMKLKLSWTRDGQAMSALLTPGNSTTFFNDTRGLALRIEEQPHVAANWGEAFTLGFRETRDQLGQVITILHRLVTGRLSATNLSGPAGIIIVAGSFASQGVPSLLLFLTMLSANLAVLNFMPIPALDGGHLLFLSAEAIRGKPVDERLQVRLTIAGVICLLSLMVFATAMDIGRFAEVLQRWFS